MKAIIPCALWGALWGACSVALAASAGNVPDFQTAKAAISGDERAIAQARACADESAWCALLGGVGLERGRQFDQAERYYIKALEAGSRPAALHLAGLHERRHDAVGAFAWSQLYLLLHYDNHQVQSGEAHGSFAYRMMLRAAGRLDDASWERAEELAANLLETWYPALNRIRESAQDEGEQKLSMDWIETVPPRYPRSMAQRNEAGWAHVLMIADGDGRVADAVVVGQSHRDFGRAALRAARQWRFDLSGDREVRPSGYLQFIEFALEP